METRAKYTTVGLFIILSTIAIIFFAFWLSGNSKSENNITYTIFFQESVTGLTEGGFVKYRGVSVGNIDEISIYEENADLIKVVINVEPETPITQNTEARLKFLGITGIAYIELFGEAKGKEIVEKDNEGNLVIKSKTSELAKLFESTPDLIDNVNEITTRANLLLSVNNLENFEKTIANIERITSALAEDDKKLGRLVDNADKATREFAQAAESMNKVAKSFEKIVSGSRDNILTFTDSGLRAITKFFNESRKTAEELGDMAKKIKENPSSIVYPKKQENDETENNNNFSR